MLFGLLAQLETQLAPGVALERDVLAGPESERGADELRGDGRLAPAAVHQRGEPHARRPAVVEQLVQRRAYGAAGVEHVVDQDEIAAFDLEGDLGALDVAGEGARR